MGCGAKVLNPYGAKKNQVMSQSSAVRFCRYIDIVKLKTVHRLYRLVIHFCILFGSMVVHKVRYINRFS